MSDSPFNFIPSDDKPIRSRRKPKRSYWQGVLRDAVRAVVVVGVVCGVGYVVAERWKSASVIEQKSWSEGELHDRFFRGPMGDIQPVLGPADSAVVDKFGDYTSLHYIAVPIRHEGGQIAPRRVQFSGNLDRCVGVFVLYDGKGKTTSPSP